MLIFCVCQVNGCALLDADHYDAVDVLKTSGNDIVMVLGREASPEPEPEPEVNSQLFTVFVPENI